jgi:hypothetical protein
MDTLTLEEPRGHPRYITVWHAYVPKDFPEKMRKVIGRPLERMRYPSWDFCLNGIEMRVIYMAKSNTCILRTASFPVNRLEFLSWLDKASTHPPHLPLYESNDLSPFGR